MKKIQILSIAIAMMAISSSVNAQNKTEKISVAGNCGMCKSNIEKAAVKAGASTAEWDSKEKLLTIKYNSSTTNAGKIEQAVAAAGYDTRTVKASEEAYNKLHACCQYDRVAVTDSTGKSKL